MDKKELYKAIEDFKFYATPSNSNSSAPATIGDIRKLITETENLAQKIVAAMND